MQLGKIASIQISLRNTSQLYLLKSYLDLLEVGRNFFAFICAWKSQMVECSCNCEKIPVNVYNAHVLYLYYYYYKWRLKGVLFQLLRSNKRHKENKRKIVQECSSMQQADYQCHRPTPWMQESVSMHKGPNTVRHSRMNQARSEGEEKERKRDWEDRDQEVDGKKGSPTKQKHIWGTKTRPT